MKTSITILLLIFSLGVQLSAQTPIGEDPREWQANASGKIKISRDIKEQAVRFDTAFNPTGKDFWAYPKINIGGIPGNAKSLSFETRAIQPDPQSGYRCGYVMFPQLKKMIRYQPSANWQTVVIDLPAHKIAGQEVSMVQIGVNPLSPNVTFWIKNLKFMTGGGQATSPTPQSSTTQKPAPRNGVTWESAPGRPIAPATGYFKVCRDNGKWWFADPAGKPFYSVGLNYCLGVRLDWPPRTEKDYQVRFDREEPLCREMSENFQNWQFNTCGPVGGNWNGRFPATPIFRCLQYANTLAEKGEIPKSQQHKFLDVYSKEFADACDRWAGITIKPHAENPLIVGWFIDNEFHLPQDEAFQDKFYQVVIAAIRKYDKNHLLLGTRFEAPNRSDLDIRMVGKHCDVISVNYYDYPHDRAALQRLYDLSGKPVIIGEFTSAAKENGITNSKYWKGSLFENQRDRAKGYERYASEIAELPFIVGAHFFMFTDRNEPKLNNWGLRDMSGKLYYEFVRSLADVNRRLPLIHEGKLRPRQFPGLKCAVNDNPHTTDTAVMGKNGNWLWQPASLYYCCTPGTAPFYFERTADEDWGRTEDGFIEYRFTLPNPIENAYLTVRYAGFPESTPNQLKIEVNDVETAVVTCPRPVENLSTPPNWAYGFGNMKLTTVTVPLQTTIPAGFTNIRFRVDKPWNPHQGIIMQGFFISSGPHKVDPDNYNALIPAP